jgi:hypothetical protein
MITMRHLKTDGFTKNNKMITLIAIFLVLKSISNGIKLLNQKDIGAKAVELLMLIVHLVFGIYLFNL